MKSNVTTNTLPTTLILPTPVIVELFCKKNNPLDNPVDQWCSKCGSQSGNKRVKASLIMMVCPYNVRNMNNTSTQIQI